MRAERFVLIILLLAYADPGFCQRLMSMRPKHPIVCYAKPVDQHTSIKPPKEYLERASNRTAKVQTALFDVTYIGFTPQAEAAFQKAIDIWSSLLTSSQTIHVQAVWQPLSTGVLGSAIWGSVYSNFPGAQNVNTYYPVALAEKMAGMDLNNPTDPDIRADFSSAVDWDYGLTGNPASKKYDLVTVVLHELGHGLGFVDSYDVYSSNGVTYGKVGTEESSIPMIYDLALENNSLRNLYHDFVSPSQTLETQLTSGSVYYNSPQVLANNSGNRGRIYAPSTFSGGSSISHVDEVSYRAGDINSLMSPQIGTAESIHDPGPIVKAAFSDMGWVNTFIKHTKLPNCENTAGPYIVKATITSEAAPVSQINLFYSSQSPLDTKIPMTPTGNPNEYSAQIPTTNVPGAYRYYISVNDNLSRSFTNPGKLISPAKNVQQYYNVFMTGPDTQPPRITHTPKIFILNTNTSLKIEATITDNIGVREATLEYKINDIDQTPLILTPGQPDSLYSVSINLGTGLNIGDKLKYRIVAVDSSSNHNSANNPVSGYNEVTVLGLAPTRDSYANNFNSSSSDFFGDGFSIITPNGFNNGAIHSEHPYLEGSGFPNNERNTTYELLIPIKVKKRGATIEFNEIVLVEPGDPGTKFGDPNFFDYVIVEGSKDGGVTWTPVADGYDSREDTAWLTRFNSSFLGNNSNAFADPALFRPRTLDLLNNFNAGDEVIIRFRLFSDESTAGWGWAIDNLKIQVDDPPVVLNDHADYVLPGTSTFSIVTKATDDEGMKSLSVEYRLNDHALQTHSFAVAPTIDTYTVDLDISSLLPGDTIHYRIVATDSSSNQGTFPPSGYIDTYILKTARVINQYVNNFNAFSNDFIGNFFSIRTPSELTDPAINSDHFYYNGLGLNLISNYSYLLTKPILINASNPYIQYDEIVIVEGHDSGVAFGDPAFNDYAIVEGSVDNGISWKALTNGYDAQDQSVWAGAFSSQINGSSSMYKQRTINILEKSGFKAGDNVLIRFRLYANKTMNGWGWSIDNLSIQGPVTAVEYSPADPSFVLYPNPASEKLNLVVNTENINSLKITIINIEGKNLFYENFITTENSFTKEFDVSDLPKGLYLLKVEKDNHEICSKKFVKD